LIRAFAQVVPAHPELRLVLAGKPHRTETPVLKALVQELGLLGRIEFRSYVPYTELPDLYRGALAFVYPSLWEGFGLPILEAMACGTPVITSRGSGTEEVAGDAALLVDPERTVCLVEALVTVLEQPSLQAMLSQQGLDSLDTYHWHKTALQTSTLLDSI
jgi:glycosyltransferase involved in cell wall biosynthesis